jgi:predicted O-methyltransferase YrrM
MLSVGQPNYVHRIKKMNIPREWAEVDEYFESKFIAKDAVLDDILQRSSAAGLPPHSVSPCQAQFLAIITKITGTRRILEIGTLGGYSTVWMARALPDDGIIVTIESNETHANVAQQSFVASGLGDRISLIHDGAKVALAKMINEGQEPFDLVFIDADKPSNPEYLDLSLQLAHSGSVIIGDNVVREGAVANPDSDDAKVVGIQKYCEDLTARGLLTTVLQTVGLKGYDGFSITVVP